MHDTLPHLPCLWWPRLPAGLVNEPCLCEGGQGISDHVQGEGLVCVHDTCMGERTRIIYHSQTWLVV